MRGAGRNRDEAWSTALGASCSGTNEVPTKSQSVRHTGCQSLVSVGGRVCSVGAGVRFAASRCNGRLGPLQSSRVTGEVVGFQNLHCGPLQTINMFRIVVPHTVGREQGSRLVHQPLPVVLGHGTLRVQVCQH
jgi:hypothetical protein